MHSFTPGPHSIHTHPHYQIPKQILIHATYRTVYNPVFQILEWIKLFDGINRTILLTHNKQKKNYVTLNQMTLPLSVIKISNISNSFLLIFSSKQMIFTHEQVMSSYYKWSLSTSQNFVHKGWNREQENPNEASRSWIDHLPALQLKLCMSVGPSD